MISSSYKNYLNIYKKPPTAGNQEIRVFGSLSAAGESAGFVCWCCRIVVAAAVSWGEEAAVAELVVDVLVGVVFPIKRLPGTVTIPEREKEIPELKFRNSFLVFSL